jgi:hypothetical protein
MVSCGAMCAQLFRKYDMVADGKLSRVEFVTMCVEVLWRVPSEQLRMATRNLDSARKGKRTRNQVRVPPFDLHRPCHSRAAPLLSPVFESRVAGLLAVDRA